MVRHSISKYLTIPAKGNGASVVDSTTETDADTSRPAQIVAYAVAHRSWIARFGLPTHIEADILRACYGVGDMTADEWSVIAGYIVPKRPYRAVLREGFWRIVAGDGTEFPLPVFEDRSDAWRHVDRLRGITMPPSSVVAQIRPMRICEPRRERGH